MFEADKYGHIRCDNDSFQQVSRHMSQPVITVTNSESVESANQLFADNPEIHHLVVVDELNRPLGILYSNLAGTVPAIGQH
jgi:CBS domain-containing protein